MDLAGVSRFSLGPGGQLHALSFSIMALLLIRTVYIEKKAWKNTLRYFPNGSEHGGCSVPVGERGVVVFIGDSVTRYQYLSFVYYLTFGVYPKSGEHWAQEKKWAGWTEFYNGTNSVLNSQPNTSEICDCYRNNETGLHEIIENRKYSGPLDVYYFQYFRPEIPLKGHINFVSNPSLGCTPGECSSNVVWEYDLVEALSKIVKPIRPHVVIINSGLHSSTNAWSAGEIEAFLDIMQEFPLPIWKTTTHRKGEMERPITDCKILASIALSRENIKILDAYNITHSPPYSETWDEVHFFGKTYEVLNTELFALMEECVALTPTR